MDDNILDKYLDLDGYDGDKEMENEKPKEKRNRRKRLKDLLRYRKRHADGEGPSEIRSPSSELVLALPAAGNPQPITTLPPANMTTDLVPYQAPVPNHGMEPWEQFNRVFAECDILQTLGSPLNINPAPYNPLDNTLEAMLPPIDIENPPVMPEPIDPSYMPEQQNWAPQEAWWTNDWEFENIMYNPNMAPQHEYPAMTPANMNELQNYGDELIEMGNRMRCMGENLVWKYSGF